MFVILSRFMVSVATIFVQASAMGVGKASGIENDKCY